MPDRLRLSLSASQTLHQLQWQLGLDRDPGLEALDRDPGLEALDRDPGLEALDPGLVVRLWLDPTPWGAEAEVI
jgi:hypothetical protein